MPAPSDPPASSASSDPPPQPGESFIPFLRRDLVQMCIDDGGLSPEHAEGFRQFAAILTAYTHFQFHASMEALKASYDCFDPDRATIRCQEANPADLAREAEVIRTTFRDLAIKANYREVGIDELKRSFKDSTLIELQTEVDLHDFKEIICYARGSSHRKERVRRMFRTVEIEAEVWQRVLLLLHFADEERFITPKHRRRKTRPELPFSPGKIYAYFYKDVPKADLELLFPNVKISMTPKDKILLSVPAVGASIMAIAKISSRLLILAGVIAFLIWGPDALERLGLSEDQVLNFFPAMTALLMVLVTLGALAFKQWDKYKNKRNSFLKLVAETLFFRNLATNQAVFHRMLDHAEEEECKEALLVYYHILCHPRKPMTAAELDLTIEQWMMHRFHTVINFDIDGPISNLCHIQGPDRRGRLTPLLTIDPEGRLHAPPLEDAKHIIDHLWDNAFQFNGVASLTPAHPATVPA